MPDDFNKICMDTAAKFLQTAVYFDDQAYFPNGEQTDTPTELIHPPTRENPITNTVQEDEHDEVLVESSSPHKVNLKPVIEGFAQYGICCSVLSPGGRETFINQESYQFQLAQRSDIVIIDWKLFPSDDGSIPLQFIKHLVDDCSTPKQDKIKLVVIYTGERELTPIVERIEAKLAINEQRSTERCEEHTDPAQKYDVHLSKIQISVYRKNNRAEGTTLEPREIRFKDLAENVIKQFATMNKGLVSILALDTLYEIRNNTSKLLSKFSPELDPAFLTHRALLENPCDADLQLASLVGNEILTIIEDAEINKRNSRAEKISSWVDYRIAQGYDPFIYLLPENLNDNRLKEQVRDNSSTIFRAICTSGVTKAYTEHSYLKWIKKSQENIDKMHQLSRVITGSENIPENDALAALMVMKHSYITQEAPKLRLGTVLERDGNYWLCLQPLCDSTRINEKCDYCRKFPLLDLQTRIKDGKKKYNLTIMDNNKTVKLCYQAKHYNCQTIEFNACKESCEVTAESINNHGKSVWVFRANPHRKKYTYVGTIKYEVAKKIALEIGNNLQRIGLDESEWQRIHSTNGKGQR